MSRNRKRQLVHRNAATVVGNLHEHGAATCKFDVDDACAAIHCVLQKLFQRGSGTLNHLASGDLIDQMIGQRANLSQGGDRPSLCGFGCILWQNRG